MKKADLAGAERILGYTFHRKEHLRLALTVTTLSDPYTTDHNERYATLGDGVLRAFLCDVLIHNGALTKGEITTKKKTLEGGDTLAKICFELGLHECILNLDGTKKNVDKDGNLAKNFSPGRICAETFEAVVGAVYLDGGYDEVKIFLNRVYKRRVEEMFQKPK